MSSTYFDWRRFHAIVLPRPDQYRSLCLNSPWGYHRRCSDLTKGDLDDLDEVAKSEMYTLACLAASRGTANTLTRSGCYPDDDDFSAKLDAYDSRSQDVLQISRDIESIAQGIADAQGESVSENLRQTYTGAPRMFANINANWADHWQTEGYPIIDARFRELDEQYQSYPDLQDKLDKLKVALLSRDSTAATENHQGHAYARYLLGQIESRGRSEGGWHIHAAYETLCSESQSSSEVQRKQRTTVPNR